MKHHGKKSTLERAAAREEERKLRSSTAYSYAERIRRQVPGQLGGLMKAAGLTRYGLEQRSGISREMIGRIARGKAKKPSLPVVAQLSHGLGISLLEFVAPLDGWRGGRMVPH